MGLLRLGKKSSRTQKKHKKTPVDRFELFVGKLKQHSLFPLFEGQLDLASLKRAYEAQKPLACLAIDSYTQDYSSPELLFYLFNRSPELFELLEIEDPLLLDPLLSCCLDVLHQQGGSGLGIYIDRLSRPELAGTLLDRRQGTMPFARSHLRSLLESVTGQFLRSGNPNKLQDCLTEFLSTAAQERICQAFGVRGSDDRMRFAVTEELLGLATRFEQVAPLAQALNLLAKSHFDRLRADNPDRLPKMFELLADWLSDGSDPEQLMLAISKVSPRGLATDPELFETKIKFFSVIMPLAGYVEVQSKVFEVLQQGGISWTLLLLLEILDAHPHQGKAVELNRVLDFALETVNWWPSPQQVPEKEPLRGFPNHLQAQLWINSTESGGEDFYPLFFVWLDTLAPTERQVAFQWVNQGLLILGSLSVLGCVLAQDAAGKLPLSQLFSDRRELEARFTLVNQIGLSTWLMGLFDDAEGSLNLVQPLIQSVMSMLKEGPLIGKFLFGIKYLIVHEADLSEWLEKILYELRAQEADLRFNLRRETISVTWEELYSRNAPAFRRKLTEVWATLDPQDFLALTLDEVRPFLEHYSFALFGHLVIKEAEDGVPATDGEYVYLQPSINDFPDSKKDLFNNRNASRYVADLFHEVGFHIQAGTFLVNFRPYLTPFKNVNLAHSIFNIAEDYRGYQHFLSYPLHQNWFDILDQDQRMAVSEMPSVSDWKIHFLQVLCCKATVGMTKGELLPEYKAEEDELLARSCCLHRPDGKTHVETTLGAILDWVCNRILSVKGGTVADSLAVVKPIYLALIQVFGEDFFTKPNSDVFVLDFSLGDGKDAFDLSDLKDLEERLKQLQVLLAPFAKDANMPEAVRQAKDKGRSSAGPTLRFSLAPASKPNQPTSRMVPRYDKKTKRTLPNGARVVEQRIGGHHDEFSKLKGTYSSVYQAVEDAIRELVTEPKWETFEGNDPEDLLIENVIEGLSDLKSIPFIDLYEYETESIEVEKVELEVQILVDASGSTCGEILETEKVFASALYQAFELLEATVSLSFFNSSMETFLYHCKDLDAMGFVESDYANDDGVAIRALLSRFKDPHAKRLMILITDGAPCGFSNDPLSDTCQAMSQAKQQGVLLRYFNVGGLSEEVEEAFREEVDQIKVFLRPSEMINYAPKFVQDLLLELKMTV